MKSHIATACLYLAAGCWSAAVSAQQACLVEGALEMSGQTLQIQDCLANRGVSETDFKNSCASLGNANAQMGAKTRTSYPAACPAKPQAVCKGLGGKPLNAHYYKRNTEDLASGEAGCKKLGGTWQAGG
jgi:hypothetical protein